MWRWWGAPYPMCIKVGKGAEAAAAEADPKPTAAAAACISAAEPHTSTSAELNAYSGLTPRKISLIWRKFKFLKVKTDHDENDAQIQGGDWVVLRQVRKACHPRPGRDVLQCRRGGGLQQRRRRRYRRHWSVCRLWRVRGPPLAEENSVKSKILFWLLEVLNYIFTCENSPKKPLFRYFMALLTWLFGELSDMAFSLACLLYLYLWFWNQIFTCESKKKNILMCLQIIDSASSHRLSVFRCVNSIISNNAFTSLLRVNLCIADEPLG